MTSISFGSKGLTYSGKNPEAIGKISAAQDEILKRLKPSLSQKTQSMLMYKDNKYFQQLLFNKDVIADNFGSATPKDQKRMLKSARNILNFLSKKQKEFERAWRPIHEKYGLASIMQPGTTERLSIPQKAYTALENTPDKQVKKLMQIILENDVIQDIAKNRIWRAIFRFK